MEGVKKHFVLVHGICLGAWCWYKVVTLLKSAGQRVTAIDLGGCGVNPKQLDEIASFSDYSQPLMEFLASLPGDKESEKVILVGHSFGGLVISLAMESFPEKILAGVHISAYMPNCKDPPATLMLEYFKKTSPETIMDCQFTFGQGPGNPPISAIFGPEYMATTVYKHCQSEDVELAKALVRPGKLFLEDMAKESLLTEDRYGSVRRFYVVCGDDGVFDEELQMLNAENFAVEEVISIANSGHMVMVSKPQELCLCLLEIAAKCH